MGFIATRGGDDVVRTGGKGAELVRLGDGDDRIEITPMLPDHLVQAYGGAGFDVLDLRAFTNDVTFDFAKQGETQVLYDNPNGSGSNKGYLMATGFEQVWGTLYSDNIQGNAGNNQVQTGKGADTLWAGDGNGLINGQRGNDNLNGQNGNDNIQGGNGRDTLNDGNGKDTLKGGNQDDLLSGGNGRGDLYGGGGNDRIEGGLHKDTLTGGNGADTFVFSWNSGNDVIKDFQDGVDKIELKFDGNAGFPNVFWDGPNTRLQHSGGEIILEGIVASQIGFDDFILT